MTSPWVIAFQGVSALLSAVAIAIAVAVAVRGEQHRADDRASEATTRARLVRGEIQMPVGQWTVNDNPPMTQSVTLEVINASPDSLLSPSASLVNVDGSEPPLDLGAGLPWMLLPGERRSLPVISYLADTHAVYVRDIAALDVVLEWTDVHGNRWRSAMQNHELQQLS